MYNTQIPQDVELPSTKKLVKSTIIAAVSAAVVLVTVVMPAEYNIDPTGVGKVLGLTTMGEIKQSLKLKSLKMVWERQFQTRYRVKLQVTLIFNHLCQLVKQKKC